MASARKPSAAKHPQARGKKPTKLTLWAYDVGFGDCILLELGYATETRFVLFDFGTKGASKPKGNAATARTSPMLKIARHIQARVAAANNGRLAAVVATHRHQDHISGFDPGSKNDGPGAVIKALKPEVVVQPWTDVPNAAADWSGPDAKLGSRKAVGHGGDPLALAPGTLSLVHRFAKLAMQEVESSAARFTAEAVQGILSVARNNLANRGALDLLEGLCPASKHDYVYAGARAKNLERALPGVKIQVLGPPTLNQYTKAFKGYAKNVPDEYWSLRVQLSDEHGFWKQLTALQAMAVRAAANSGKPLFRGGSTHAPPEARWLVKRLGQDRGDSVFEVVRSADNVLNNTSVMLLLTIGSKRLLFPGDAQFEAWEYVLEVAKGAPTTKRELAQTDVYKVGHHGSLNATPKASVWEKFAKRGPKGKRKRLTTVLSTAEGYYGGKKQADTEVPRKPLVEALRAGSDFHATSERRAGQDIFVKVDIPI